MIIVSGMPSLGELTRKAREQESGAGAGGAGETPPELHEAPRCEALQQGRRVPGTKRHETGRCRRPAVMRVLVAHGPGVARYANRCGVHAGDDLGPMVASVWDPLAGEWVERPPRRCWW